MIKVPNEPLWRSDPIQYLVLWKFPDLNAFGTWRNTKRHPLTGSDRTAIKEFAEKYRSDLHKLSDADLASLIETTKKDEAQSYKEHQENEERRRTFNLPRASAEYSHWASASYWTLDEAVALSFGKDPRVVNWKLVEPYFLTSPFAKAYASRRDLVQRAKVMGQLWNQTIPFVFIAWAERMRFSLPEQLTQAIKALGLQIRDWKSVADEQEVELARLRDEILEMRRAHIAKQEEHSEFLSRLSEDQRELQAKRDELRAIQEARIAQQEKQIAVLTTRVAELETIPLPAQDKPLGERERNSLLKLTIGMAIKGYSYDPSVGRSPIAKEIAGDLALVGVPLDEDTVRKYLTEARDLIPGDITEQKS